MNLPDALGESLLLVPEWFVRGWVLVVGLMVGSFLNVFGVFQIWQAKILSRMFFSCAQYFSWKRPPNRSTKNAAATL